MKDFFYSIIAECTLRNFFKIGVVNIKNLFLKLEKIKILQLLYQIILTISILTVIYITILDLLGTISIENSYLLSTIDNIIWIIFTLDYWVRFYMAENKKIFFKTNIPDLLSTIPVNPLFTTFRVLSFLKILRIIRLIAVLEKILDQLKIFAKLNGFIYTLYLAIMTIAIGSIGIYFAEKGSTVKSFPDAIWWSFVTATTVGYGDISPSTFLGRCIAVVIMIIGIGTISMLTGTISTYFINNQNKEMQKHKEKELMNELEQSIHNKIEIDFSGLTEEDIKEILQYVEFKKSRNK